MTLAKNTIEIDELKSRISNLSNELDTLRIQNNQHENEISTLKEEIKALNSAIEREKTNSEHVLALANKYLQLTESQTKT